MRSLSFIVVAIIIAGSVAGAGCMIKPAGAGSKDFLTSRTYTKLVIEIDYQNDKTPRDSAIDLLKQRINERCNKPAGVESSKSQFADSRTTWSDSDLRSVEKAQRGRSSTGTTLVLHILYLAGSSTHDTSDSKVLGVAFGPTQLAIFKDTIDSSGGIGGFSLFSTADIERSVIVHEFGHMLGLVNLGTPMVTPHEDPDHPHNSSDKDSVMYWAIESSAITRLFNGPPPTQFDGDDIADLQAAGGK